MGKTSGRPHRCRQRQPAASRAGQLPTVWGRARDACARAQGRRRCCSLPAIAVAPAPGAGRTEESVPAATVTALRRRHLIDDHVARVQQVPAKKDSTCFTVVRAMLGERLHLLECVLDDDEPLLRRYAIDELHGAGSFGARQCGHGRPNTCLVATSSEVVRASWNQGVVRSPAWRRPSLRPPRTCRKAGARHRPRQRHLLPTGCAPLPSSLCAGTEPGRRAQMHPRIQ